MNNKTKNYLNAIAILLDEYSEVMSNRGCDEIKISEYIDEENLEIFFDEFNQYQKETTFNLEEDDLNSVEDEYIHGWGFIDFLASKIRDTIKNEI